MKDLGFLRVLPILRGTLLRRTALLLSLLALAWLPSGCVTLSDPEASQDFSVDAVGSLEGGHTVGQTFVARRPRLDGVDVWLSVPAAAPAGELLAELYADPGAAVPLASARVALSGQTVQQRVPLRFTPLDSPAGQSYYLRLSAGGAPAWIQGRNGDAYPAGQAFVDGQPLDADIAFRPAYDYGLPAMLGDLAGLLPRLWLALPLLVLLFLPGWLLLDLAGLRAGLDAGQQAALACGLSLAVVPLLLLWTSTLGLSWSHPAVLGGAALLAAAACWRVYVALFTTKGSKGKKGLRVPGAIRGSQVGSTEQPSLSGKPRAWEPALPKNWSTLALGAILALTLGVRLAMVRDLAAPAWVDSVHHALITRLILDQGSLPSGYAPFLPAEAAGYHAGFHSVLAAFCWLSGLDVPQAMLLLGQVLNALMVLAAYLLALELTGDRVVGVVAALVVGLISPMPAYYASWGRYTELAGLLILPAAFVLARRALQGAPAKLSLRPEPLTLRGPSSGPKQSPVGQREIASPQTTAARNDAGADRRYLLLAALAAAGLALVHNRVAAFYGCLLLADWAGQRWGRGAGWRGLVGDGLRLGLIAAGAAALTLPWLGPALSTLFVPKLGAWSGAAPQAYLDFSWSYLVRGLGQYVLVLAGLGLGWALLRRQRWAAVLAAWLVLLFLLASPGLVGLPGGGFVNFTSVEIALFLLFSVWAGYVVSQVLAAWRAALAPRWTGLYRGAVAALAIGLALFAARAQVPILNVDTALFRQADAPALAWIRDHIPPEALIAINPMPWSAGLYAGHDGGYWIAPLAGRQTMPPPLLYGLGSEQAVAAVNRFCAAVVAHGQDPDGLWSLLQQRGVAYVYVGARGGVLSASLLASSRHFRTIYARDGVSIFQVAPG